MSTLAAIAFIGTAVALGTRKSSFAELGSEGDVHLEIARELVDEAEGLLDQLGNAPPLNCSRRINLVEEGFNAIAAAEQNLSPIHGVGDPEIETLESRLGDIASNLRSQRANVSNQCLVNGLAEQNRLQRMNKILAIHLRDFRKARTCKEKFKELVGVRETMAILANPSEVGFFEEGREPNFLRTLQQKFIGDLDEMKAANEFFERTCLGGKAKPLPESKPPPQIRLLTRREKQQAQILVDLDPSISPAQAEQLIRRRRR